MIPVELAMLMDFIRSYYYGEVSEETIQLDASACMNFLAQMSTEGAGKSEFWSLAGLALVIFAVCAGVGSCVMMMGIGAGYEKAVKSSKQ